MNSIRRRSLDSLMWSFLLFLVGIGQWQPVSGAETAPKVGDIAADFELTSVTGDRIKLTEKLKQGSVVLVVLRGFPGYQCPVCNKQVGQFLQDADKFKAAGVQVLFVYPGPSKNLSERAKEFIKDKTIPDHFHLLVDPDYQFTNAYHLRWNAADETAYPSTFVIAGDRKLSFVKISQTHGGRTKPDEVLEQLKRKQ